MKKKLSRVVIIVIILNFILGMNMVNAEEAAASPAAATPATSPAATPAASPATTQNVTITNEKPETKEHIKAKIIKAGKKYKRDNGVGGKDCVQNVTVKILEGEKKGEKFEAVYILTYYMDESIVGYPVNEGDTVYVSMREEKGELVVDVQDVVRQNYLIGLIAFFFASIILVGRKKGVKAIIGLLVTVLAVFFVLITTIYKGYNAIAVSIGTCFIIIILTFTIIGGWNKKTISAALGTLGGIVLAGIIAMVFGYIAKLSGAGKEEVQLLSASGNVKFNYRDLLFAEIIVSALGACMDVGMSIASSLSELKMKNPTMSAKELFKSGMNIGGDMIGTMTNTLILSFIGNSMLLVFLYMSSNITFGEVINIEAIVTESVCALSGSIGIVYTVPITAGIFAYVNRNKEIYKMKPDNKLEGKRTLKI